MKHVFVDYEIYQELKNEKYKLARGIGQFKIEDLDQGVMFFDKNLNFIEPERLKIENIEINKVLLPRFLFLQNIDKLEDFMYINNEGNKITFLDLFKDEEKNIEKYGLNQEQEKKIDELLNSLTKAKNEL